MLEFTGPEQQQQQKAFQVSLDEIIPKYVFSVMNFFLSFNKYLKKIKFHFKYFTQPSS